MFIPKMSGALQDVEVDGSEVWQSLWKHNYSRALVRSVNLDLSQIYAMVSVFSSIPFRSVGDESMKGPRMISEQQF